MKGRREEAEHWVDGRAGVCVCVHSQLYVTAASGEKQVIYIRPTIASAVLRQKRMEKVRGRGGGGGMKGEVHGRPWGWESVEN